MEKKIEELELRSRTYGVLKRGGVNSVEELMELTVNELCTFRNLGRKDLYHILDTLVPPWNGDLRQVTDSEEKKALPLGALLPMLK